MERKIINYVEARLTSNSDLEVTNRLLMIIRIKNDNFFTKNTFGIEDNFFS